MTVTAAQILQVRRMAAELTATTYSDAAITAFIEAYPVMDERGEEPYTWDTSTTPPTQDENDDWIDTYDLNAAAADIWEEKAAVWAAKYDFTADGGTYHRSQGFEQAQKMARHYRSRRQPGTRTMVMRPKVETDLYDDSDLHN
jgi:hypothetical protein